MDLIGRLIEQKEKDINDIDIKAYLEEIIKYDKLSKLPKFKHIKESPVLQKQMPLSWKAFNGDPQSFYVLLQCQIIVENVINRQLVLFEDLFNNYNDKKKKQLNILGNSNGFSFNYLALNELKTSDLKNDFISLQDTRDDRTYYSVIKRKPDGFYIFSGSIYNKNNEEQEKTKFKYKPYKKKVENIIVRINTFSIQGNNNYYFAAIKDSKNFYKVSMLNDKNKYEFKFMNVEANKEIYKIMLSKEDENLFNINVTNIDVIADIIIKYFKKFKQEFKLLADLSN